MFSPDHDKLYIKTPIFIRLSDFFVDLFGTLIPGIIFTACLFLLIVSNVATIITFIANYVACDQQCLYGTYSNYLKPIIEKFYFIFILLFIVNSYIFGHIFYRFGCKLPDQKSFLRICVDVNNDNWVHDIRCKSTNKKDVKEKAVEHLKYVEWPYLNLKNYLENRLSWLAHMVIWTDKDHKEKRTKTFMNVIKDAIQFQFPDKYGTIARNEAHVRLLSSTWFMGNHLMKLSFITIIMAILLPLLSLIKDNKLNNNIDYVWAILSFIAICIFFLQLSIIYDKIDIYFKSKIFKHIFSTLLIIPLLGLACLIIFISEYIKFDGFIILITSINFAVSFIIFLISYWVIISIERSFHYQRVREIVFILSTAFQARKIDPNFCREIWPFVPLADKNTD